MRIAHICLSCFYIDGFGYQENELVQEHVRLGHEVRVIASTETFDAAGKLHYLQPGTYVGTDNAQVIRLPYRAFLPHPIMRKLRMHPGVMAELKRFRPEAILFHGTCGWELRTVANYVNNNRGTIFYIDSHEDKYNSAKGFVSRELLHKRYYAPILRSSAKVARKVLCVSTETMDFVEEVYGIERAQLEFFPLGGFPLDDPTYAAQRKAKREELGAAPDSIIIIQSGKQTRQKRLLESLDAFAAVPDKRLLFLIAGVLGEDVKMEVEMRIRNDPRVRFLGWQSRTNLTELLCAADVYIQPGTQSATMQHALCCRCAVILDSAPSHRAYHRHNGWLVRGNKELKAAISALPHSDLEQMKRKSEIVAREILDYRILAGRVLR